MYLEMCLFCVRISFPLLHCLELELITAQILNWRLRTGVVVMGWRWKRCAVTLNYGRNIKVFGISKTRKENYDELRKRKVIPL